MRRQARAGTLYQACFSFSPGATGGETLCGTSMDMIRTNSATNGGIFEALVGNPTRLANTDKTHHLAAEIQVRVDSTPFRWRLKPNDMLCDMQAVADTQSLQP